MENELISKRELLDMTGVSYGQLYRWKRKNLIPEEWFIKKASFTGQETFFPRDKILERIYKIINMKEDQSLDNLADVFSGDTGEILLTKEEILDLKLVSQFTYEFFIFNFTDPVTFNIDNLIIIYLLDGLFSSGVISEDEGKMILETLLKSLFKFQDRYCEVYFIRKLGTSFCLLVAAGTEFFTDSGTKVISEFNVQKLIEEIKIIINKKENKNDNN